MNKFSISLLTGIILSTSLLTACSKEEPPKSNVESEQTQSKETNLQPLEPVQNNNENEKVSTQSKKPVEITTENSKDNMTSSGTDPYKNVGDIDDDVTVTKTTTKSPSEAKPSPEKIKDKKQPKSHNDDEVSAHKSTNGSKGNADAASKNSSAKATTDDAVAAALKAAQPALEN